MKKSQNVLEGAEQAVLREEKRLPNIVSDIGKQANVSMYYGFTPVKAPEVSKDDATRARPIALRSLPEHPSRPLFTPEEKVALVRSYLDNGLHALPQPVMLHYKRPFGATGRKNPRETHLGLDIIGAPHPTAEALVIQTACAILSDEGFGPLVVELNSVGDKDSMARHERELCAYYRRHAANLAAKYRGTFKKDPCGILVSDDPECAEFRDNAPKSMSYLTEAGRRHFMEVIEHLEHLNVPYRLNHSLIGHRGFVSHVVFEIREDGGTEPLAYGFRYNTLSRKLGFKKELPAVGISISYRKQEKRDESWKPITKPRFYLIQFGSLARLKSLHIIEMLRREGIAVYHALTKDKLMGQMAAAESLGVPFVLIIGQKEAMEGTVVVRNMLTREQETIGIALLTHYLRRLR